MVVAAEAVPKARLRLAVAQPPGQVARLVERLDKVAGEVLRLEFRLWRLIDVHVAEADVAADPGLGIELIVQAGVGSPAVEVASPLVLGLARAELMTLAIEDLARIEAAGALRVVAAVGVGGDRQLLGIVGAGQARAAPAVVAFGEADRAGSRPGLRVFLLIRLMIPAEPSGENSADGLVITSTRSMESAGRACRAWPAAAPLNWPEGLPSSRIVTLESPRSDTLPCGSTSTEGMLRSASLIEPVVVARSLAMP